MAARQPLHLGPALFCQMLQLQPARLPGVPTEYRENSLAQARRFHLDPKTEVFEIGCMRPLRPPMPLHPIPMVGPPKFTTRDFWQRRSQTVQHLLPPGKKPLTNPVARKIIKTHGLCQRRPFDARTLPFGSMMIQDALQGRLAFMKTFQLADHRRAAEGLSLLQRRMHLLFA
ncbi:hypothetical protein [Prosthecobacter sp.]|uniref:hypothetical protein n=1 Tax=Prosthecobacter sp. TaxID=1965333 RepID=UPI003782FA6B